jgi:hypothetical protein
LNMIEYELCLGSEIKHVGYAGVMVSHKLIHKKGLDASILVKYRYWKSLKNACLGPSMP